MIVYVRHPARAWHSVSAQLVWAIKQNNVRSALWDLAGVPWPVSDWSPGRRLQAGPFSLHRAATQALDRWTPGLNFLFSPHIFRTFKRGLLKHILGHFLTAWSQYLSSCPERGKWAAAPSSTMALVAHKRQVLLAAYAVGKQGALLTDRWLTRLFYFICLSWARSHIMHTVIKVGIYWTRILDIY